MVKLIPSNRWVWTSWGMSHRIFHPNALRSCEFHSQNMFWQCLRQICPFHKGFCTTHYAFGGMLPASHMASFLPKIGQLVCPQTFGPLIQNSRLAKHRSGGGGDSINSCIYIVSCIIHAKKTRKRQNHGMDIWVCPNIRAWLLGKNTGLKI